MSPRTRLPDTVKATDPKALEVLTELAQTCAALRAGEALQEQRMARRNDLFRVARDAGVSWADLGRVAGIAAETVLQVVQRVEAAR